MCPGFAAEKRKRLTQADSSVRRAQLDVRSAPAEPAADPAGGHARLAVEMARVADDAVVHANVDLRIHLFGQLEDDAAARIRPFEVEASREPLCWPTSILPLLERATSRPQVDAQQILAFEVKTLRSPITSQTLTEPLLERARMRPRIPSSETLPLAAITTTSRSRGSRSSRLALPWRFHLEGISTSSSRLPRSSWLATRMAFTMD